MIRRLLRLLGLVALAGQVACAQYVTLTGTLQGASGLTAANYTLALQPSQIFYVGGTSVVVNTMVFCGTSSDGSVVGIVNPSNPLVTAVAYSGTLAAGTYYIEYAWYDAAGHSTLASTEQTLQLTATGQLQLSPPTQGKPAAAVGMNVYIGATSGAETLQGQTTGTATFVQSVPLTTGAALPSTNTTLCKVIANDVGWPTGTGYNVTFSDPSGNVLPGYPMMWRLLGPNTTIDLSNGLPTYNGLVTYPVPILATPYNHTPQSISGPLSLTNYNLTDVARLGLGTSFPAWAVDAEGSGLNGAINAKTGFLFNGTAGTNGQALCSDGSYLDQFCSFIPLGTAFYYQTVDANGTPLTQRSVLNFDATLSATDSPSPAQTNVGLPNKGTAGSCTACNITFDAQGRETSSSSNPVGINAWSTFTGCSFPDDGANESCTNTVTIAAMPDTSYLVNCAEYTTGPATVVLGTFSFSVVSTTQYTVTELTQGSSAEWPSYHNYGKSFVCTAHHS